MNDDVQTEEAPMVEPLVPVVQPLAPVTLTRVQILCWPRHDCRTKGSGAVPDWVLQTWALHDIIRVYSL